MEYGILCLAFCPYRWCETQRRRKAFDAARCDKWNEVRSWREWNVVRIDGIWIRLDRRFGVHVYDLGKGQENYIAADDRTNAEEDEKNGGE